MAHVTADRVRDTSTSTSTGSFVVSGTAPSGFRTLSAVLSVNDTFYYAIQSQGANEWEVGVGTYSSANTFARTTVLSSSNAGSAVNFSAGTKDVFLTLAAARTIQSDASGSVGTIQFAAGTVSAPGITTVGDTNTGIFFPAADSIALVTAGTEDFRIGPSGQFGVQGANYGTSGQVLTSGGASAAPSWATPTTSVINTQTFDSSNGWTKPSGYSASSRVFIQAWAGGGSGARHTTAASASGGGGGGYSERWVNLSQLGATETVTIGAGGVSRTGSNQSGAQGGNTSVTITTGGTFTVYGGAGGISAGNGGGGGGQLSAASGFTPGLPFFLTDSGGAKQGVGDATTQNDGAAMFHGGGGGYTTSAPGKNSVWGGGGGGGAGASGATVAGTSINGGSGGTGGATGTAGTQPAGGGGGGTTTSGAGAAGRVIITVFPA